jgi:hypothetical protein
MNRPFLIAVAATGLIVAVLIGFVAGWRYRQFQLPLQKNKIAAGNLKYEGTKLPPVFQEYLKARIYCNVRNYYPSKQGNLLSKDWDFGPADRNVLGIVLF